MSTYGPKGLAIFQVNNDGYPKGSAPVPAQLAGWVQQYKPAGASGIDPRRKISKYYYDGGMIYLPYNFILEAKTRKVLARAIKATDLATEFAKYLK